MGVIVRQKVKGRGKPWWVFLHHNGMRKSTMVGDRETAEKVAKAMRAKIKAGELKPFASLMAERAQQELTPLDYYQMLALRLIKYFYMLLIGGLISFMIFHQFLDFLATRREMKKGGAHS